MLALFDRSYSPQTMQPPSKKTHLVRTFALLGAVSILGTVLISESAKAFSVGTYRLHNHPDGGAAAPYYGLRLDGLLTGNSGNVYTFDFDHADSKVLLKYDGSTIKISGTVFGGRDAGPAFDPNQSGLWDLNFSYNTVAQTGGNVGVPSAGNGTGTIESKDFAAGRGPFQLIDYAGNNGYSFRIATGHRGFAGYSGFGWLNHAPTDNGPGGALNKHLSASDWLFTAKSVPEPTTILATLMAAGGAHCLSRKRRKLSQKSKKESA